MQYKKYRGITWDAKRRKWYARIMYARTRYAIGRFETEDEAIAAYKAAQDMGLAQFKAWYSKDPNLRGSILDITTRKVLNAEEDLKIKSFSFLKDMEKEDESLLIW